MARVHTHYDNLKVARDAPMEVIHAAYRSLAAMYHPDRNGGSEEAARIMRIVNSSYVALCDPVRKREHDRWIDNVASDAIPEAPPPPRESNIGQEPRPAEPTRNRAPVINLPPQPTGVRNHWMWLVTIGIVGSVILFGIFFGRMPDNTTPTVPAAEQVARPVGSM